MLAQRFIQHLLCALFGLDLIAGVAGAVLDAPALFAAHLLAYFFERACAQPSLPT